MILYLGPLLQCIVFIVALRKSVENEKDRVTILSYYRYLFCCDMHIPKATDWDAAKGMVPFPSSLTKQCLHIRRGVSLPLSICMGKACC
jgi:hypothetical protein